jgi:hypothetical protein
MADILGHQLWLRGKIEPHLVSMTKCSGYWWQPKWIICPNDSQPNTICLRIIKRLGYGFSLVEGW